MARRSDRDDPDDRRGRRGRYPSRGGDNTVILVIVGVVVCAGLIGGTYFLVRQEQESQRTTAGRTGRRRGTPPAVRQIGDPTRPAVGPSSPSAGPTRDGKSTPMRVNLRCSGKWEPKDPSRIPREKGLPDPRRVDATCPSCGRAVNYKDAKCSCGQALEWPSKMKCGFCGGKGICTVCGGDGMCPQCKKYPAPRMMGISFGCPMGCTDQKCPACRGSRRCDFCEGTGTITLQERHFKR